MKDKREQKQQKGKLGAKSKIKLKNYVKTNKGTNKRFKQVHNENEVNKAMAELSDGELKEAYIEELTQSIRDGKLAKYWEEVESIQEVIDETNGIDGIEDEIDFKEREQESWEDLSDEDNLKEVTKSFRDKFLAGAVIGGLLALAFIDIFFNK